METYILGVKEQKYDFVMHHRKDMTTHAAKEMGFEVQNGPDRLTMTRDGHEEQNGIFSEIFPKEKQYELIKKSRRPQRGANFWTI